MMIFLKTAKAIVGNHTFLTLCLCFLSTYKKKKKSETSYSSYSLLRILIMKMYTASRVCKCLINVPSLLHQFSTSQMGKFHLKCLRSISVRLYCLSATSWPYSYLFLHPLPVFPGLSFPRVKDFSHLPDLYHHFVAYLRWLLWPTLAAGMSPSDPKDGQS